MNFKIDGKRIILAAHRGDKKRFPENFAYCREHDIIPCVCVPDDIDTYQKYVSLGCRMFTSNDIYEADRILKELGFRRS